MGDQEKQATGLSPSLLAFYSSKAGSDEAAASSAEVPVGSGDDQGAKAAPKISIGEKAVALGDNRWTRR